MFPEYRQESLNPLIQPQAILALQQSLFSSFVGFWLHLKIRLFACHISWRYNTCVLCPNDNSEMRRVQIASHYGGPIFVDQCDSCGGIWFDESNLFRAKQGEAEKIEALNTEMLRTPSVIENSTLFCPRDQGAMQRFTDKYFPQDIVLVRCPSCHGIWLNRGTFTKYQQFRQKSMPKKKSPADERVGKAIAQLTVAYNYECERSTEVERREVETALNVLKTILGLILRV